MGQASLCSLLRGLSQGCGCGLCRGWGPSCSLPWGGLCLQTHVDVSEMHFLVGRCADFLSSLLGFGRGHLQFLSTWVSLYKEREVSREESRVDLQDGSDNLMECIRGNESRYFYCVALVRSKSRILHTQGEITQGENARMQRLTRGLLRVRLSNLSLFSLQRYSPLSFFCSHAELMTLPLPRPTSCPVFPDLVSSLVSVQSSTLETQ